MTTLVMNNIYIPRKVNDTHRPRYHFLPPAEWMNDPNGPIWWNGEYHLFYQYGPLHDRWALKYWGHAVSSDLVHWRHLPFALEPTPGGPDKDGVWSGCAVDNDGELTLIYTGIEPEVQCIATSRDGINFEKYAGNPVISAPPEGLEVTGFRDPCVWRESDGWYMIVGSGIKGVGGAALLYHSPDLRQWEYLHPLCVGKEEDTGEMWECPDLFPLGGKHVLLVSPYGIVRSMVGEYVDHQFVPERLGVVDFGPDYYAPKSFLDGKGRRILWGWCWEGRNDDAQHDDGWAGVMSLPRVLTLCPDGKLGQQPAPEVESLRRRHRQIRNMALGELKVLDGIAGDCLELRVIIEPGDSCDIGIKIRRSPDGEEETDIFYFQENAVLGIDRNQSSLCRTVKRGLRATELKLAPGEPLDLRIFLDRSLIEIFANDRLCMTDRIYPVRKDSTGIAVYATGTATLQSLDVWEMRSIY